MMKSKLGQEPAFATSALLSREEDIFVPGINQRLYIATFVMQALLSRSGFYWQGNDTRENLSGLLPGEAAKLSLQYADALLKQEKEEEDEVF